MEASLTKRTLHPAIQRLLALVVLGVALGAAVAGIAAPLADAMAQRNAAQARLAKFETLLKAPLTGGPNYKPEELSAAHIDDAEAQIALQSIVDRVARGSGVAVQSVRPLAAEYMNEVGRGVWVEMTLSTDLQGLTDFLSDMDAERPVLLIRRLDVERGDGPRPDLFLRVRLEAGRIWRAQEGTP